MQSVNAQEFAHNKAALRGVAREDEGLIAEELSKVEIREKQPGAPGLGG